MVVKSNLLYPKKINSKSNLIFDKIKQETIQPEVTVDEKPKRRKRKKKNGER